MSIDFIKYGQVDLNFDPFSEDYVSDFDPNDPFADSERKELTPFPGNLSLFKIENNNLNTGKKIGEFSEREGYLNKLTVRLMFDLLVPSTIHGIKKGIPWRRYVIASTPDQFQQLFDKEMERKEIIDKQLFINK